ncbi:uncharacterized protein LOC107610483 [Arachis ipaensis]|uniref:uncharacterized protein LOC107610483 n=1 Tax=Arachis ipaensis TaxID=130454 RepID=UPI0007AF8144|nr:uncharacterized protein LOC107610483 [Arachis ipaensis]
MAELQEELFAAKQGDLSITLYFTKLKGIWKEMDNFSPIPNCKNCTAICDCGLEPLTKLDDALLILLQQERQNAEIGECKTLITTTNSRANSQGYQTIRGERNFHGIGSKTNGGRGGRSNKQCTFCGRSGHIEDVCYKKHGLPPHLRNNNGSNMINNVIADDKIENISNIATSSQVINGGFEFQFSIDQKMALLTHLEKENSQHSNHNSNNHVVALPSNQVQIQSHISVKVGSDLRCRFIFNDSSCEIQDRLSKRMIGVAVQKRGLYAFENLTTVASTSIASVLTSIISPCKSNKSDTVTQRHFGILY